MIAMKETASVPNSIQKKKLLGKRVRAGMTNDAIMKMFSTIFRYYW
jgi:hypothetical protein